MNIYDISMRISADMPVYKGRPAKRPRLSRDSDFSTGAVYETRLDMNLHTGTHIDMPLHILENGANADTYDAANMIVRCNVLDFSGIKERISRADLENKHIAAGGFVLLKTRNSFENILEGDYVFLDQSGAQYLQEASVRGVGIDALGIERSQPGHETHKALLSSGIVIMEGLRLSYIPEGEYILIAAPIQISGAEAAPVKAILLDKDAIPAL